MKKILLVSAALLLASVAFPQGTIVFDNQAGGTGDPNAGLGATKAYVYGVDPANPTAYKSGQTAAGNPAGSVTYGGALLTGTGFSATLWARNAANVTGVSDVTGAGNNLAQVGTIVGFRAAGLFAGRISPSAANPIVSDVTDATQRGTFQLRVWDNKGGTIATWDQALTAFRAGQTSIGYSPLFTVPFSLGGFGALPNQTLAPNLTGLQSFQLYNNVPEPSTIALGILGAGCLFLLRRRK